MSMLPIETLLERARAGDREAVEGIVREIQDDVYGLAIRMLWHPQDAEDASQEILIRVITHLGTFRGESSFRTWVCRIATNHLLNVRKSRVEKAELTFSAFARDLQEGLAEPTPGGTEQSLLEEEVKIGCTRAMLLCLDRDHRMAYILGEVFGVSSEEGAEFMQVDGAAFRKRLSRARERIRSFMGEHCGLVDSGAACRCARRIAPALKAGRVDPAHLLFARPGSGNPRLRRPVEEMEKLHRTAALFRSQPDAAAPESLLRRIRSALEGGRLSILDAELSSPQED
ncbi:MAG: RNA polymerase sigma factor [Planctomycetes bacterium]|nr:RNA polymerase sigma factor [Planctomycetota bacterium]